MQQPVISVIVPVYNVEKYLKKCLDSILCQTFSNIEIICVNDGSTDNSRKILTEYKQKDSRIKIVDKKNGGLSSARNAGMKVAKGEFFSFIDSDDWVTPDMLEKLYNNIVSLNSDISICAVHLYDDSGNYIDDSNPYYTLGYFNESFDGRAFNYKDVKPFLTDVCVMAWNKLYRRSLIEQCNAVFPEGYIFEDGPFFFSIFFKARSVSIVRDFLYYYRVNRKGSIIDKAGKKFLNVIDVVEMLYGHIKDLPDYDEIKNEFYKKKVQDILSRYNSISWRYTGAFIKKLKNECSLADKNLFPPDEMYEIYHYTTFLLRNALKNNRFLYNLEIRKLRLKFRLMYKIIEILYYKSNVFTFKFNKRTFYLKKNPSVFDAYYLNDRIFIKIFNKLKINFKFDYSLVEKFYDNE